MQDKKMKAVKKLQQETLGVETAGSVNTTVKRVHYPDYWKKKLLNPDFVKKLQQTVNKEPVITDKHGEYKDGVFLHGCNIVIVSITDDLWSLEIHSEHAVGLHTIKEIRYKYLPDEFLMAQLFPTRAKKGSDCKVILYQIPGSLTGEDAN